MTREEIKDLDFKFNNVREALKVFIPEEKVVFSKSTPCVLNWFVNGKYVHIIYKVDSGAFSTEVLVDDVLNLLNTKKFANQVYITECKMFITGNDKGAEIDKSTLFRVEAVDKSTTDINYLVQFVKDKGENIVISLPASTLNGIVSNSKNLSKVVNVDEFKFDEVCILK